MRATRVWALVALATAVAGCATTGTPPPGGFTTKCKEIDLSNVSLEPTTVEAWDPKPLKPGFLHIQRVAFIVGPLAGFPADWSPDGSKGEASTRAKDDWLKFFTKLRKASEH